MVLILLLPHITGDISYLLQYTLSWTPGIFFKLNSKAISSPNNNWRKRRTEHHFYAEIVTDITTRTTEYINKVTQITRSELFGSL
jgi:hypothetical protein